MTNKPTITLKNIDIHVGLSDETPAYTAKLFVDGKHFANVSNQGHGGCDMYDFVKGESYDTLKALQTVMGPEIDDDIEVICHTLTWEHVDKRNLKSRLSRTVIIRRDDKLYNLKGKKSKGLIEAAVEK